MIDACFYYEVPSNPDVKTSFQKFADSSYEEIQNIDKLVSKLASAEKELGTLSNSVRIYSGIWKFPVFFFNIEDVSPETFTHYFERLLEMTDPLFPFNVESSKEGYKIIQKGVRSKYKVSLKRTFRDGKNLVVNSVKA